VFITYLCVWMLYVIGWGLRVHVFFTTDHSIILCRWERLGDMAILPGGSLNSSSWSLIGSNLWTTIAAALGVKRVARQASTNELHVEAEYS
jgi:hypothetical protein